jgi:hypothetical protein
VLVPSLPAMDNPPCGQAWVPGSCISQAIIPLGSLLAAASLPSDSQASSSQSRHRPPSYASSRRFVFMIPSDCASALVSPHFVQQRAFVTGLDQFLIPSPSHQDTSPHLRVQRNPLWTSHYHAHYYFALLQILHTPPCLSCQR